MTARLRDDAAMLAAFAVVVILFGVLARGDAALVQGGTYVAIFAPAAIGLSLLLGNVNQISVGQAGFFGIGAYAVGYLTVDRGWSFWLAAPAGVAIAALVGVALGFIALRFRGHYLAMATLAFGLITVGVFHATPFLGRASGITDIPYPQLGALTISGYPAYWFAWAVACVAALLTTALLRSRIGRAFEAMRNDRLAAESSGVPTRRNTIVAFAYAGALAAAGGATFAAFLGLVNPEAVGIALSVDFLLMVVLGGSGLVAGALAGAALIGFANVVGHQYDNWREVVYGVVDIGFVVFAPRGILGLARVPFERRRERTSIARAAASTASSGADAPALADVRAPSAEPLAVRGVTKRFGGLVALDGVSFALRAGTLTSVIGPNGAGKTTLFNAICGVGAPSSGSVAIGGVDVAGAQPHRIAALGVGRTFQAARLFDEMTVLENVMAGAPRLATAAARERARDLVARMQLEPIAGVLARDLAFGDRRRVELARAVAAEPWLLLADEPAAGLNDAERRRLHADLVALRDAGTTVLLIEHDMRLVMAISERVIVLNFGRVIADGTPDAVRSDPAVIAAYLGAAS
ncbi:MAG TPA: branched-chain amino acid ABC transporter ATP-binding protein/permease [Candidatus Elarobacter sp.]|nr:branched-chain amino acid ABC transporter ATP-binding protein/permease [Candidatus Elarobacter sp.]